MRALCLTALISFWWVSLSYLNRHSANLQPVNEWMSGLGWLWISYLLMWTGFVWCSKKMYPRLWIRSVMSSTWQSRHQIDLAAAILGLLLGLVDHFSDSAGRMVAPSILGMALVGAFIEEIVLRGVLYEAWRVKWGWPIAASINLLVNLVAHLPSTGTSLDALTRMLVMQTLILTCYHLTRRTFASFSLHGSFNLTLCLMPILQGLYQH